MVVQPSWKILEVDQETYQNRKSVKPPWISIKAAANSATTLSADKKMIFTIKNISLHREVSNRIHLSLLLKMTFFLDLDLDLTGCSFPWKP